MGALSVTTIFLTTIAFLSITLSLISGLNSPGSRELSWITGNIQLTFTRPLTINLKSPIVKFWGGPWQFCEGAPDYDPVECYSIPNITASKLLAVSGVSANDLFASYLPSDFYMFVPYFILAAALLTLVAGVFLIIRYYAAASVILVLATLCQLMGFAFLFAFYYRLVGALENSWENNPIFKIGLKYSLLYGPGTFLASCALIPLLIVCVTSIMLFTKQRKKLLGPYAYVN